MSLSDDTRWRTASECGGNGSCVEVAKLSGDVGVRDSRTDRSPVLRLGAGAWRAFVSAAVKGHYDPAS